MKCATVIKKNQYFRYFQTPFIKSELSNNFAAHLLEGAFCYADHFAQQVIIIVCLVSIDDNRWPSHCTKIIFFVKH